MFQEFKPLYRFGIFTVDPDQKVLLREGRPLAVTPKVFDTLLILVQSSGRLVKKEDLMGQLWPNSFVEEANLSFNIKQLRKSLGDDARKPQYIETVPRRGFRFIAKVEEVRGGNNNVGQHTRPPEDPARVDIDSPKSTAESEGSPHSRLSAFTRLPAKAKAVVFTLTLLLVVAGFVFSRFSFKSNQDLRELVAALPLKIEKLTATGESSCAAISSDGKYLAYTRGFVKSQSIWLRQLATNTNIQIVPADGPVFGLAIAHSGEYLYFVRGTPTALYRVSLLGDAPIKIVYNLEGRLSLSPDDRQIAFIRQATNDDGEQLFSLMIANADGTGERKLLERKYPDKLDTPVWSPDGESLICSHGNSAGGGQSVSLLEVTISDAVTRELSTEKFANIVKIVWLPQKQGLLMAALKNSEDYLQLWRVSYPMMNFRQITAGLLSYTDLSTTATADKIVASQTTRASDVWIGHNPQNLTRVTAATDKICWTPTRRIIYSSRNSGSEEDLWIMHSDGSDQKQLTFDSRTNATPTMTADGRHIVFVSNRTGVFQIWRMNTDGSNQTQLTNGGGKNFSVVSPDGKWVLYNSTDTWNVWKSSIEGGEPIQVTNYPAFFPAVSPDGKFIACLGRSGSKAALLIVPFDGGPPVKTVDLGGLSFSGTRIAWTPDGQALLYAVERDGMTTLLRHPVNGRSPQELGRFEDDIFDFDYSTDGQELAVTRGGFQHDVVLIKDLNLK